MKLYRHGDLLIRKINNLPTGLKKINSTVLAHGESGNSHTLVAEPGLEVFEDDKGRKYFKTETPTQLQHQEHKTIEIETGFFEVIHEQERDPFTETINQVKD